MFFPSNSNRDLAFRMGHWPQRRPCLKLQQQPFYRCDSPPSTCVPLSLPQWQGHLQVGPLPQQHPRLQGHPRVLPGRPRQRLPVPQLCLHHSPCASALGCARQWSQTLTLRSTTTCTTRCLGNLAGVWNLCVFTLYSTQQTTAGWKQFTAEAHCRQGKRPGLLALRERGTERLQDVLAKVGGQGGTQRHLARSSFACRSDALLL